jgi:hypothetical protein
VPALAIVDADRSAAIVEPIATSATNAIAADGRGEMMWCFMRGILAHA